jgi:hypothetical protein
MMSPAGLRRTLFYLFLLAYLLVCPVLLLFMLGYDIRLGGQKQLVRTGDLYVASFPAGAALYVDGSLYPHKTPTSVLNLSPGPHRVTVRSHGYRPWTRHVVVSPGLAAPLNDILLIPRRWRTERLPVRDPSDLLPFSSYPYLLLRRGPRLRDLFLYEIGRGGVITPAAEAAAYGAAEVMGVVPLARGSAVLLELRMDGRSVRLLIAFHPGGVSVKDLTELIPQPIGAYEWVAGSPDDLLSCREGKVTWIDAASQTAHPDFLRGVRGLGARGRTVYAMDADGEVTARTLGTEGNSLVPELQGIASILRPEGFVRIVAAGDGVLIFVDETSGRMIAARGGDRLELGTADGYQADTEPGWILTWGEDRLGIVRTRLRPTRESAGPSGLAVRSIDSPGSRVSQAFLVLEGTHVLYRDRASVYLLNVGLSPGQAVRVARVRSGSSVSYSDRNGVLYYIDDSSRATRLEVIPRQPGIGRLLRDLRERF